MTTNTSTYNQQDLINQKIFELAKDMGLRIAIYEEDGGYSANITDVSSDMILESFSRDTFPSLKEDLLAGLQHLYNPTLCQSAYFRGVGCEEGQWFDDFDKALDKFIHSLSKDPESSYIFCCPF
ncbi:hypothetical protein LU293_00185 [Moraxella nasovis]|uniref:hypothetical protein n=1 Tax=Moraxella nasovis TaxID=2904121 RepID=UPI001F5FFFEE|nr:hypothetical protein [Moraxella nasovis]UNU73371.1 hypothetical protein LU293_00185 [Moraxella nasovis]